MTTRRSAVRAIIAMVEPVRGVGYRLWAAS